MASPVSADDLLRAIFAHAPLGLIAMDLEARFTLWEGKVLDGLGYQPEDVLGRSAYEVFAAVPGTEERLGRIALGEPFGWEGEVAGVEVLTEFYPTRGPDGALTGTLGFVTDVTARKRAEGERSRGEAWFRAIIEKSSDVVWVTDRDSRTTYVSPAVLQLAGWAPEELIGHFTSELVHPDDMAAIAARRARVRAEPGGVDRTQLRLVHRDGSTRWISLNATNLLDDPNVRGVISNVRDMTDRKKAEDAVQASEQRYRQIVESTSDGVCTLDPEGRATFANRRMADLLGTTVQALIGRDLSAFVDPTDQAFDAPLRRVDGGELRVEVRGNPLFAEDGTPEGRLLVVTDLTERRKAEADLAHLAAIVANSDDAILSVDRRGILTSWNHGAEQLFGWSAAEALGRDLSFLSPADVEPADLDRYETVRVHRDGTRVPVALTISPIRGPAGDVVGTSVIARDLTERRRAEGVLERAEAHLRQAQKMDAIGTLAGGVAHDFNNLLSVILGYSDLVLATLDPREPLAADVGEIRKAGDRARDLTRQLLAFSRQQALQPRVLQLNTVIGGMEGMLRRLLRADIELSLLLAQPLGTVHADPTQIEQIVMNLVVNAVDAMPTGGRLALQTANVEVDPAYAADHLGVVAGPYVLLAVTDTGAGMDRETRARIFEPFFTTKDKGKGTGLGLSTVYGIVQQSGGAIWVYSEPGQGTVFKVYLPRSDRPPDPLAVAPPSPSLRGTETVLLVEDEEQVRILARTVLRRAGYNVLDAQNGGEAFLVCEQFQGRIHLLLTDVVMPRMSGRQLADRVAPLRPDMRVLYMSGYTDDAIVHHGVVDAGVAFLEKPITPEALVRRVREELDRG